MKRRVSSTRSSFSLAQFALAIILVLIIGKVNAQDVPPTDCPPTPQVTCCPPATTSTAQSWPVNARVNVNIDPSYDTAQRAAIVQSFENWRAAGTLANNGSGVTFMYTYNATSPSMNPPPGTYNIQVWYRDPPRNTGLAGDNAVTQSGGRVISQEIWINTQSTDSCAIAQTAAHEIGHGFGLGEAPGCGNNTSVMNAGTNGYNGTTGTYGPTSCDNSKVNQIAQYPKPAPAPTPVNCARPPDCPAFWRWKGAPTCECMPSPVVVDIEGDGLVLSDAAEGVRFDLDVDGNPEWRAWTLPWSDDAWLVLDRNGNGLIDNGAELFGDRTPQPIPPLGVEMNGFLALAEFDKPGNGGSDDGRIDKNDSMFSSLRLWQDINHNGISEPSELHTLRGLGLKIIELNYKQSKKTDQYGNEFRFRARVKDIRDAPLDRWAWDVFLVTAP